MNLHRTLAPLLVLAVSSSCAAPATVAEEKGASQTAISGGFAVGTQLQVTADVNLRASPRTSSAVLELIPNGTVVRSASASPQAGWYGVTWNGKTGWVDGQYVARPSATTSSAAPAGGYSRQQVYDLAKNRVSGGGTARDFLDPGVTTQELVDAVGWLATHSPPDWGFSVINTGHHADPLAHSSGYAIDFFANNAADDARFVQLVNQDPYFVEIGLGGEYQSQQGLITSSSKCSFIDGSQTHVHGAVRRAYC